MDEVIGMYEDHLKNKYPHRERIEFDVNEVLEMVFQLPDCAALVFDQRTSSYIPHDKSWIQKQVVDRYQHSITMARGGKSVVTNAPKQPKETKAEKEKRLEHQRIAREQAKKFVIPGIIAILACVAFLLVNKYGLRGTKLKPGLSSTPPPFESEFLKGDMFKGLDIDKIIRDAAKKASLDLTSDEARNELTKQLTAAFLKEANQEPSGKGSPKEELEGVFAGAVKGQKQEQEQEVLEEVDLDENNKEASEIPNEPKS
ncbi:MAG: hypothetical protein J3Q66DRAFT_405276 [Benniella sp.]|nr:MAG: hypothetical protein J3Q66DRAFT_405276 [Benniella sp.]